MIFHYILIDIYIIVLYCKVLDLHDASMTSPLDSVLGGLNSALDAISREADEALPAAQEAPQNSRRKWKVAGNPPNFNGFQWISRDFKGFQCFSIYFHGFLIDVQGIFKTFSRHFQGILHAFCACLRCICAQAEAFWAKVDPEGTVANAPCRRVKETP